MFSSFESSLIIIIIEFMVGNSGDAVINKYLTVFLTECIWL